MDEQIQNQVKMLTQIAGASFEVDRILVDRTNVLRDAFLSSNRRNNICFGLVAIDLFLIAKFMKDTKKEIEQLKRTINIQKGE